MARWRWRQESEPDTPQGNMAADEALLHELRDDAQALPIVRIYTWDRPCISIGRLQDEQAVRAAYPHLPLVRRPTGGRAVQHGDDLTVSLAARLSDLPLDGERGILPTYRLIVAGLIDAFGVCGTLATLGEARSPGRAAAVDCFKSTARCDVVDRHTGRKLAGCAQRRSGEALLQQMSIPLANLPEPSVFLAALRPCLAARMSITAWEESITLIRVPGNLAALRV